jgi:drug/metabolite transporter (DMT)-like permease
MAPTHKGSIPSPARVHGALGLCQVLFGAGAVVGALGLPAFNPLVFALLREALAAPLLATAAYVTTRTTLTDVAPYSRLFGECGALIFGNQVLFVVGLKLSNPVAGAIWQPSQPIFTAALASFIGAETPSPLRFAGVALAFLGCATMVSFRAHETHTSGGNLTRELCGHVCFFGNCLCTSVYVLRSKQLLRRFPALCVTAGSYVVAALCMLVTCVLLNSSEYIVAFLCPDCTSAWAVPRGAWLPLLYWVLCQSCAAYALMTWANRVASASLVSGYSALQPVTAAVLAAVAVALEWAPACTPLRRGGSCLAYPGVGDLGAVGVFAGLYLVVASEPAATSSRDPVDPAPLLSAEKSSSEALGP